MSDGPKASCFSTIINEIAKGNIEIVLEDISKITDIDILEEIALIRLRYRLVIEIFKSGRSDSEEYILLLSKIAHSLISLIRSALWDYQPEEENNTKNPMISICEAIQFRIYGPPIERKPGEGPVYGFTDHVSLAYVIKKLNLIEEDQNPYLAQLYLERTLSRINKGLELAIKNTISGL